MTHKQFEAVISANAVPLPPLPYIAWRNEALRRKNEIFFAPEEYHGLARLKLLHFDPGTTRTVPVHFQSEQ